MAVNKFGGALGLSVGGGTLTPRPPNCVSSGVQVDTAVSGGFVTDGGPGSSTIGLRDLDPERTLVLVNGRRMAPSGVEGAPISPDVNLIPSALINIVLSALAIFVVQALNDLRGIKTIESLDRGLNLTATGKGIMIAFGVLGGAGLVTLMLSEAPVPFGVVAGIIGLVVAGMAVTSALACIVPTRRALAVQPMEALRTD